VSYLGAKPPLTSTASGVSGTAEEEKDQSQAKEEREEESTATLFTPPSLSEISTLLKAALEECGQKLQVLL